MKVKTLHKAVNVLTVMAGASNPEKNRANRLAHLKEFGTRYSMTKSDWEAAKTAALARLPQRLSNIEAE